MKLSFGGGASEIGASFLLLRIDGKNIALDCGVRMSEDPMPDFQIIKEFGSIDCIVLSHAHMDHSGALPVLSREYPNARIYMTHASKDLVRILLYDSLKIMDYRETGIPIYADIHVEKMLDNIVCYSPNHTFSPFSDSDIRITFYGAGHIAGAAGIFLAGEEGSFFYSGDFSATKQQTVEGAAFPKLRPDVAVFESTYGDRLHASRDIEETRLIAKIASITGEGGKLLIPAFALGRSQEIILIINRAINKKQLPGSLKVYVDGMVNDICRVYQNNPNYLRTQYGKKIFRGTDIFYNDNVIPVNKNQALRDQIVASRDGLVIISSSGMLTGGPSQWYAEKLAGDKRNAIALTGYQDEESPGRQLLDMIDAVRSSEGDGDAVQRGDGDAVRSSEGDGDAVQCSSGDAVRSSEGDGDAVQRGGGDAVRSSDDGAVEYSGSVALHSVGNAVHSGSAVPANDHIFKIGEKSIPFQCDIGMYGLSAHADKMEILALAQTFAARNVFFNHGGEEVVNSLAAEFQKEYNGRVYIPKNGEVFTLNIRNKRKQAVGIEREPLIRMPTPNPPRPSETLTPTAAPNPLMPHETPTTAPNPLMPHETPTVAPNPLMPHETPT
ncbi:MAG: MBL fold metallo-hydrolase, partial [Oscillospiraceae bacterium]|nr:MBL fold metallo-hydrolase [Oscillospiraceae bacterium]